MRRSQQQSCHLDTATPSVPLVASAHGLLDAHDTWMPTTITLQRSSALHTRHFAWWLRFRKCASHGVRLSKSAHVTGLPTSRRGTSPPGGGKNHEMQATECGVPQKQQPSYAILRKRGSMRFAESGTTIETHRWPTTCRHERPHNNDNKRTQDTARPTTRTCERTHHSTRRQKAPRANNVEMQLAEWALPERRDDDMQYADACSQRPEQR